MSEVTDNGGPAFPAPESHLGMTLRDYFAAKAMQAITPHLVEDMDQYNAEKIKQLIVSAAYSLADAMLAARKAKPAGKEAP